MIIGEYRAMITVMRRLFFQFPSACTMYLYTIKTPEREGWEAEKIPRRPIRLKVKYLNFDLHYQIALAYPANQ